MMKISYERRWGHPRKPRMGKAERKAQRHIEAQARQAEYNRLTLAQKVARCKSRRGNSKRELARLEKDGD